MGAVSLFILVLFLPGFVYGLYGASNETDFWENFANNFATDLAPIISLFGEQITKQFLSESTTVLDTIIFCIAPLGIITAVVSCIRVRGGSFLKSVVGRAREPHGMAEVELCSSTSDDVCELWSNGGVCRVFGGPKILEFFYRPPQNSIEFYNHFDQSSGKEIPATCGIELTRELFDNGRYNDWQELSVEKLLSKPFPGWLRDSSFFRKLFRMCMRNIGKTPECEKKFAKYPNLALNIGVQKTPKAIRNLWIATFFGVALQISFFGYATWATWYAPNFYDGGRPSGTKVYFSLLIIGTFFLIFGMAICAHQIDSNSTERRFTLSTFPKASELSTEGLPIANTAIANSRVFWLQPAGQRIGDQEFEAFAHDEERENYITSWKADPKGVASSTFVRVAVVLSVLGWAAQFVGLRGLHATISLYQLCCTVVMSMIRAMLRSFRDTTTNKLEGRLKSIIGHELDWQTFSFNIDNLDKVADERYWALGSLASDLNDPKRHESTSWRVYHGSGGTLILSYSDNLVSMGAIKWIESRASNDWSRSKSVHYDIRNSLDGNEISQTPPNTGAKLMRTRSRLAYLASQPSHPPWESECRRVARQLKACLEKAATAITADRRFERPPVREAMAIGNKLFKHAREKTLTSLVWSTTCDMWEREADSVQKEKKENEEENPANPHPKYLTDMPICFEMTAVGDTWNIDENQLESTLGLWLWSWKRLLKLNHTYGFQATRHKTIAVPHDSPHQVRMFCFILGRWGLTVEELGRSTLQPTNLSIPIITKNLGANTNRNIPPTHSTILTTQAESSILHLMAQDIFTTFIEKVALPFYDNLVDIVIPKRVVTRENEIDQADIKESQSGISIQTLIHILTSEELATQSEAIMAVVPGFSSTGKLFLDNYVQNSLFSEADFLRQKQDFIASRQVIRQVLEISSEDFRPRVLHFLCNLHRSELRFMVHRRDHYSIQSCRENLRALVGTLSQERTKNVLGEIYAEELEELLSRDGTFGVTEVVGPAATHIQAKSEYLPRLDGNLLRGLNLDLMSSENALRRGITLIDNFNLKTTEFGVRKELLRWAIEIDCVALLEDLWKTEPDDGVGKPVFSCGYDELLWALSFRTQGNDMMNTIVFLLHVAKFPLSTPFQLQKDIAKPWWNFSTRRHVVLTAYKRYNRILPFASAISDGLETVQLLTDGFTADDLATPDYEAAAFVAMDHGNLDTLRFLLSRMASELKTDKLPTSLGLKMSSREKDLSLRQEQWGTEISIAARWGHQPYMERLLATPPGTMPGVGYKHEEILRKAKETVRKLFPPKQEEVRNKVLDFDRQEIAEIIQGVFERVISK
ncbi:hypothetical protein F53441_6021 [Fusarium austroafricanum]|uniref:Ankyrin repeat protein n=1 Tax=Fusarium austroafricanum TaxID=2364996 RepID=A0A8H4NX45_9HYPO|nr:hypothetical protein F53441_6021 [Fusarium austroafricanum]